MACLKHRILYILMNLIWTTRYIDSSIYGCMTVMEGVTMTGPMADGMRLWEGVAMFTSPCFSRSWRPGPNRPMWWEIHLNQREPQWIYTNAQSCYWNFDSRNMGECLILRIPGTPWAQGENEAIHFFSQFIEDPRVMRNTVPIGSCRDWLGTKACAVPDKPRDYSLESDR